MCARKFAGVQIKLFPEEVNTFFNQRFLALVSDEEGFTESELNILFVPPLEAATA
jgi:hypothetical protein